MASSPLAVRGHAPRTVPVQLHAVLVGGRADRAPRSRHGRTAPVERNATLDEGLQRSAKRRPVRIKNSQVVEAGSQPQAAANPPLLSHVFRPMWVVIPSGRDERAESPMRCI